VTTFFNTTQEKLISFYQLIQKNIDAIANYILIVYAFFIAISADVVHDGFHLLLILFLFKKDKLQTLKRSLLNPIALSFVLYVAMNYLGVMTSDDQAMSLTFAKYYRFFLYSVFIIAFAKYEYLERIIASFLLGVIFSALISYGLIFNFIEGPFLFSHPLTATLANPAPFMYHIEFGFLLAFSSVLLLQMIHQDRSKKQKVLLAFFFLFISICIFLNISRTGYILYLLGIILFYFLHFRHIFFKVFPFMIVGLSLIIVLVYFSSSTFKERSNRAFSDIEQMYVHNNYGTSLGLRIVEMEQAFDLFLQKPLLGYGTARHVPTMYEDAKEKNIFYAATIKRYSTTDNQYFDVLLQWGILGLLIFLNIFYQAFRYPQKDRYLREIQIILLVLTLINGLQTYTMIGFIPHTFFFILSLTAIQQTTKPKKLAPLTLKYFILYIILLNFALFWTI